MTKSDRLNALSAEVLKAGFDEAAGALEEYAGCLNMGKYAFESRSRATVFGCFHVFLTTGEINRLDDWIQSNGWGVECEDLRTELELAKLNLQASGDSDTRAILGQEFRRRREAIRAFQLRVRPLIRKWLEE